MAQVVSGEFRPRPQRLMRLRTRRLCRLFQECREGVPYSLSGPKPTSVLPWSDFFPTWVSPDAERAYGTVLRHLPWPVLWHAKRNFFVRLHRSFDTPAPQPVAGRRHLPKRCFGSGCARPVATLKGAGEPHRTPALFAGIDAVPCASAPRPPGVETPIGESQLPRLRIASISVAGWEFNVSWKDCRAIASHAESAGKAALHDSIAEKIG